jgi:hypothetical protein
MAEYQHTQQIKTLMCEIFVQFSFYRLLAIFLPAFGEIARASSDI